MTLETGTHKARPTDWGVKKSANGDPQPWIKFAEESGAGEITWFGTFKPGKGREIAFNTLQTAGFRGSHPAEIAAGTKIPTLFDTERSVEIVVEDHEYNGKTYRRVQWVNDPDKKSVESLEVDEAKALIGGMNIDADWEFHKEKYAPKKTDTKVSQENDLPF